MDTKCQFCKRKSHVLIECKCGSKVCLKCKIPETHSCAFDFRLSAQYKLAINNPTIIAKKLEQI
jgi:hypothetical protein